MSSAPTGRASGIAFSRERVGVALQGAAALAITAGFAFLAVRDVEQIRRLLWRPEEVLRALREAGGLATVYPGRFLVLVLGSVALMVAAEFRARLLLEVTTAVWIGLGCVGTGAYLLGALEIGTRWAIGALLAAGAAVVALMLTRMVRATSFSGDAGQPPEKYVTRLLFPVVVGVSGGLLAVRASIEPVTEWDAVVYHVSFARDWIASLPDLPHAAGPSIGNELSYNYPALFPSITAAIAAPLHLGASTVARILSPLAAITIFAVLRASVQRSGFAAWAAPMFLLGSTFFVAYAQWPTSYMIMTLLLVLAVVRLVLQKQLLPSTALCLGLAAATGLIGMTFAAIILFFYAGSKTGRGHLAGMISPARSRRALLAVALLVLPLAVVVVSSLRRTGGLFFPWITWPHAAHLLPPAYWSAAKHEILANSFGQFGATIGSVYAPIHGVATSGLLAPGGLAVEAAIALVCGLAYARRRSLVIGTIAAVGAVIILVVSQLVWPRYFIPLAVAAVVGLGAVIEALRRSQGGWKTSVPYAAAVVAAGASLVSGVTYALAGPNDRGYTALTNYRLERATAFESAREASDASARRDVVYGDDARAWSDIAMLSGAGFSVGTFDIRNYFVPYVPRLQLDGLAGAAITGDTASKVARQLKLRGIDLVFVPSWFWEPGGARHPLADRSPVALWVGSPPLRAVRTYLPNEDTSYPSVLYVVGDNSSAMRRVRTALGQPSFSIEGPLSSHRRAAHGAVVMSGQIGGPLHWRIAAPVTEQGGPNVRLTTADVGATPGVTVYEPRDPSLVEPGTFVDCRHVPVWARQSTLDVGFPGSPIGFASLDVGVSGTPRNFRAVVQDIPKRSERPLVRACGDPTTSRGGVFPARSNAGRIIVELPQRSSRTLSFDYLDSGTGAVSFNVYDDDRGRWLYKVAHLTRCDRGGWRHAELPLAQLPVRPPVGASLELGPVVTGGDFVIRNLRLGQADGRLATPC